MGSISISYVPPFGPWLFLGFFMWPPNLNPAQHMQHSNGVSLLSLGTHWEFHWPSAFVDHSDEVVAFEAHDSEFVVAAELRRPLRPLEPRPLSSSGLRMKPGHLPKNGWETHRMHGMGISTYILGWFMLLNVGKYTAGPPLFGNFEGKLTANSKNHIGGYILHTNPGSPTTHLFLWVGIRTSISYSKVLSSSKRNHPNVC